MSTPATIAMPVLVARGVSKRFGAVDALFDFDVDADEVVALVGDNGTGKSTLIKAIAGVQPADAGDYWMDGRRVSIRNPSDASRIGIATVYLLDEPTAALGVIQTAQVLSLIEHLREQGLAIVISSHNLDTVFHVADRISVLRLGRHVATFERRVTAREDVVAAITGAISVSSEAA